MARSRLRRIGWVLGMLVCFLGLHGMAARTEIALELEAPRAEYLLDEPLLLRAGLTNLGQEAVGVLPVLDPAVDVLTLEVSAPGEPPHTYAPRVRASISLEGLASTVILLGPAETYSATLDLTYELLTLPEKREPRLVTLLSKPGEYRIRACYRLPQDWPTGPLTLLSNEVRLLVRAPEGRDRAAHEILQGRPHAESGGFWSASPEHATIYEQVIRNYPETGYAVYALDSLGCARSAYGTVRSRGTPEGLAALEEAAALGLAASERAGDTPFGIRAKGGAAISLARLGRSAEAQALLEEVFLSPMATDEVRARTLYMMKVVSDGTYQRDSGFPAAAPPRPVMLFLREFMGALGFSAYCDPATHEVTVTGPRVRASFWPGDEVIVVNGTRVAEVQTGLEDGRTLVSPSVILALMEAHWGREIPGAEPVVE